jgi:uncharacterized protein (UPF0332 family)
MTLEQLDYIRLRVSEARTTLDDARLLFGTGSVRSVVNRLYYACFYAASALVCTQGLRPKKHSGLLSAFSREWIKTGRFPPETGDLFRHLFDLRIEGDYQHGMLPTAEELGDLVREVQGFLDDLLPLVSKFLDENAPKG